MEFRWSGGDLEIGLPNALASNDWPGEREQYLVLAAPLLSFPRCASGADVLVRAVLHVLAGGGECQAAEAGDGGRWLKAARGW